MTRQALYLMATNKNGAVWTFIIIIIKFTLILASWVLFSSWGLYWLAHWRFCVYLENFSPFPAIPLCTMVIWIGRVTIDILRFLSYYLSCDLAGSMEAKRVFPTSQDIYALIFFLPHHLFYQFPSGMAGCPILGFVLSHLLSCQDKHGAYIAFDWPIFQPAGLGSPTLLNPPCFLSFKNIFQGAL